MSESSSMAAMTLPSLEELLGGIAEPVQHTPQDLQALEADILAGRIRTLIKQAMEQDDVTVRALAQRLDVSPSVISRRLSSDGDLKVWTAAALAHALGRVFEVTLRKAVPDERCSNWAALSAPVPGHAALLAPRAFRGTATATAAQERAHRPAKAKSASCIKLQTA